MIPAIISITNKIARITVVSLLFSFVSFILYHLLFLDEIVTFSI